MHRLYIYLKEAVITDIAMGGGGSVRWFYANFSLNTYNYRYPSV